MPSPASRRVPRKQPVTRVFAPGARVVIRDEEWMVRTTHQTSTGGTAVSVTGLSELVRGMDAIFLTELDDVVELRPEETELVSDPSPQFRRSKLYLESLLRQTPPTDGRLYVGHRGAMNQASYQLVPATKALAQPRARILVADAVGLGKTIEAGVLLSELIRRGQGRRILVVALKSVLEQFQEEMWARFTIPLVRLDSVGIQRVQRKIPANQNPFYYFPRTIISIDTLKKDAKYRRYLEHSHWDAIVVDECQHVAVRTKTGGSKKSQRAQLAQLLADHCDSLILTSATPHDGRPESFASLMNLLDPTAVADPSSYTQDEIQGLYVRRFKKDIAQEAQEAFHERDPHLRRIDASPEENAVFARLATAEFKTIHPRANNQGVLFRTLLLKSFLSSPAALRSTIAERLKKKALRRDEEGHLSPEARHDTELLHELDALAAKVTPSKCAKLEKFIGRLTQMNVAKSKTDNRVVVFSERIATLDMLEEQLRKQLKLKPDQIATFHGTLDDQKQQALVKDFGTENSKVRVLLASDAAAEGINLHHYCHRMIHFDIPWSLMTLEQRNGRIDRYGQKHRPELDYLLTAPDHPQLKGDLRVLELLIEREQNAHKNLGDACWLMNLHDAEAEADRVAEGISRHEPAERIIPEEPQVDDFLSALMGASQAETRRQKDAPQTVEPLAVYPHDLGYAREALLELSEQDETVPEPKWQDHLDGFTLNPPPDLRRRFEYLPPELRHGSDWELKLTAKRDLVQDALAKSRQDKDRWPEWQLLWELHPVMEWLNDRVLAHFRRHEAPVVRVTQGLAPDQRAFVFQGVLSNKRSQPVVVDWFAVTFKAGKPGPIVPLRDFADEVGLTTSLTNDGTPVDTTDLEALREQAVSLAKERMQGLRESRKDELLPALQEEQKRLKAWRRRGLQQLEDKERAIEASGRKVRSDERKRMEDARAHIERQVEARNTWIKEGVTTSELPYIRLALVVTPATGKPANAKRKKGAR